MNKLNAVLLCSLMVIFASCSEDYSSDIESLENRVSAVESDIASLQSDIDSGATISSVTSTDDGIKITLSTGVSYELTNGTDGAAGSVVTIGDNGNWFIDGVDQKISASSGAASGVDGLNGDYYVPNTETGCFDKYTYDTEAGKYVSETTTISYLATGVGAITAVQNEDGTVTFFGVEDVDGNVIDGGITVGIFNITSLLVSPQSGHGFAYESNGNLPIAPLYFMLITEEIISDTYPKIDKDLYYADYYEDEEGNLTDEKYWVIVKPFQTGLASTSSLKYIVNPSNATAPESWAMNVVDVDIVKSTDTQYFKFNTSTTITDGYAAIDGKFDAYYLVSDYVDAMYGEDVDMNALMSTQKRFYLQAILEEAATVTSDVAVLDMNYVPIVAVAKEDEDQLHGARPALEYVGAPYMFDYADDDLRVDFTVAQSVGSIDLNDYVGAAGIAVSILGEDATKLTWLSELGIDGYTMSYSIPSEFYDEKGLINQQDYVTLSGSTLSFKDESSAIGRKPVVEVTILSDATFGPVQAIATAYVVFQIDANPVEPIEITLDAVSIAYEDLYARPLDEEGEVVGSTGDIYEFATTPAIMTSLLNELGISAEEFVSIYKTATLSGIVVDGENENSASDYAFAEIATNDEETAVEEIGVSIYGNIPFGDYEWTVTVASTDAKYPDIILTQAFTIEEALDALPTFYAPYVVDGVQEVKGYYDESINSYRMAVEALEAFDNFQEYLAEVQETYVLKTDIDDYIKVTTKSSRVTITRGDNVSSAEVEMNSAIKAESTDIPMKYTLTFANGATQTLEWTIRFINPLSIEIDEAAIATTTSIESVDLREYVTVKFNDEVVFEDNKWDSALQSYYGLTFTWNEFEAETNFVDYLTVGNNARYVSWNNGGTKLTEKVLGGTSSFTISAEDSSSQVYAEMADEVEIYLLKYGETAVEEE